MIPPIRRTADEVFEMEARATFWLFENEDPRPDHNSMELLLRYTRWLQALEQEDPIPLHPSDNRFTDGEPEALPDATGTP